MNEQAPVKTTKNAVRGISIFLAIILFVPSIKEALSIKLFKWQDGFIGLWQIVVLLALGLLLWALVFDENEKLDIPFFNKFIKND